LSKLLLVQVLRAVAALAVTFHHTQFDAGLLAQAAGLTFTPSEFLPWPAGVDLFFVISGFIMVHASGRLFGEAGARSAFLTRRIARIVPLYWGVTTLYLCVALVAPAVLNSAVLKPWPVLASYLFIPFVHPDGLVQPLYSLGWTLNYEMAFYGLFALVIALPRRQAVLILIAMLTLLSIGGALLAMPQPFDFWTDSIILEFAFGLLLGQLWAEGVRLGRPARGGLVLLGLGLLMLDLEASDVPRFIAWGVPAAFFVAAATLGREAFGREKNEEGAVVRMVAALGDASYALYLIHPFVIRGVRLVLTKAGLADDLGAWGYVGVVLLGAVAAAVLVYRFVERPITGRVRWWLEAASGLGRSGKAERV
jgi:peptidoglycan/LPS O-acetylase OafA/YrhL